MKTLIMALALGFALGATSIMSPAMGLMLAFFSVLFIVFMVM
jgi:hypothetical protein